MKSDTEVAANYNFKLHLLVVIYNTIIVLSMAGLIYHFNSGWPMLMIFLLKHVEFK